MGSPARRPSQKSLRVFITGIKVFVLLLFVSSSVHAVEKPLQIQEEKAQESARAWLDQCTLDLALLAKKGYGDKKRLSELLGVYWVIHSTSSKKAQEKIETHLKPYYLYTFKDDYLNLHTLEKKAFKKNSMSSLRIMWLLREMHFDIVHLRKEFSKIKPRMDAHLKQRGAWQKSMFARYYDMFGFKKPQSIAHTEYMTGIIGTQRPLKKYKTIHSYMLTHQVFVAFDYGAKRVQTRFNAKELQYLESKIPKMLTHYLKKKNWDLLAELLTCMVYLKQSQNKTFKIAYKALLKAQNKDGSWGNYEKYRKAYGDFVKEKFYLHTTGVVLETMLRKTQ